MSRNDLVGVVRVGGAYYVLVGLNADTQWSRRYARYAVRQGRATSRHRTRASALVSAHDAQKRVGAEYGVREL